MKWQLTAPNHPEHDTAVGGTLGAYITGKNYFNEARDFDIVTANSYQGGKDKWFVGVIDYVFERVGNWR